MDKGYIAPEAALKKLRAARSLGQTVYIYGATGYGKTELVRQYLKSRRYRYISCGEDATVLTALAEDAPEGMPDGEPQMPDGMPPGRKGDRKKKDAENEPRTVVVLDDLHLLKDGQGRKAALSLTGREDIWLILMRCVPARN